MAVAIGGHEVAIAGAGAWPHPESGHSNGRGHTTCCGGHGMAAQHTGWPSVNGHRMTVIEM